MGLAEAWQEQGARGAQRVAHQRAVPGAVRPEDVARALGRQPPRRDAGQTEFQAFYGNADWQTHWDWHHASESESEEPEEPGERSALSSATPDSGTLGKSSSAGCEPRAKRKRKPNMVWSPPSRSEEEARKEGQETAQLKLWLSQTKTRKLTDGFLPYRTRFTKHTNTIVFYEQYLLAHTSDNRSSGDGRRVQDSRGIELARAHVAWAKHSLRGTLLELVETVNPGYVSLPDEAFDEDGIDAELIECCAQPVALHRYK